MVSWLLPSRLWRGASRAIASLILRLKGTQTRTTVNRLERFIGGRRAATDAGRIALETVAASWYLRMQILGSLRPGGWRPVIELRGSEHLEAALAGGNGAILWVAEFGYDCLVTKMALARAGHRLCHLSRPIHGFSATPFGAKILNPLWVGVENRYLTERMVMHDGKEHGAMRTIARRLRENRIVSITVGTGARKVEELPFLSGRIRLPTGPVNLAVRTGAALLPVFTVCDADGHFEVHITAPLAPGPDAPGTEPIAAVLAQYAARLEDWVLTWPGQWRGWPGARLPGEPFADG